MSCRYNEMGEWTVGWGVGLVVDYSTYYLGHELEK